jgi:hypothetical protein
MSAPIRRPIVSDRSSYLDSFDEFEHERTGGNSSARTLKPPPEIWELVHPVSEEHFKPAEALAGRLANRNLFMVVVAILLASGVSLAAWKFHIPQKVAAVFAEPDVPAKKSAPMTARHTTVDATKTISSTGATMTNAAVIQPTAQGVNNDVAQPITTARMSAVRKPSKSGTRAASAAAAAMPSSITTTSVVPSAGTKSKAQPGTGASSVVSGENKNAVNATDTAAKSKPTSAASPQLVAPVKPTPAPKPKVIQWP